LNQPLGSLKAGQSVFCVESNGPSNRFCFGLCIVIRDFADNEPGSSVDAVSRR